jgi:hypothetical protein
MPLIAEVHRRVRNRNISREMVDKEMAGGTQVALIIGVTGQDGSYA